ncbi:hypothetical protein VNO78_05353 [Psophocarpus tetragonolobus]|uniref:BZIP domain-containing protein n=1 Tax=Psophocarpus tetragonolobus TaxID=3891 RepID=A0AAN9XRD6_PSOTE
MLVSVLSFVLIRSCGLLTALNWDVERSSFLLTHVSVSCCLVIKARTEFILSLMAEQNKRVARSADKISQPKGVTQNMRNPLPSPWSAPTQAYPNFGSTPTSSITGPASQFYSPWFGSQMRNTPIQYGSVCNGRQYSNFYPLAVAGASACSLLASAHIRSTSTGKNNMDLLNTFNRSLQPVSKVTAQSREKGKRPSTVVGHDVNNAGGSAKFSFKLQDFPSINQYQSSMKIGNGGGAQDATGNENTNIASHHFKANPTEFNQKLSTKLNTSGNDSQLAKEESDETEEKRKRQAKRKAKRSKRKFIKLQDILLTNKEQASRVPVNGGGSKNVSSIENWKAVDKKTKMASDHFEANLTELNQKLSADSNTSASTPQLEKKEIEAKELRRKQTKKTANKRARMKTKMEREKLINSLDSLDVENAALKEKLDGLSDECEKLTKVNNSLMEELFQKYGKEVIMNRIKEKPNDSVAIKDST